MLTFMANLRVMKMDGMGQLLATGNEQAQMQLYNTIQGMNAMMNNNSLQVLGENDSYETHQYTFGGIGETYDRFMMDVAGAAEIPVTKLFGRSPAGMNATGESDMQNYYDTIEEKQEAELRPVYDKILPIMFISTFGGIPDDWDYEFNPIRRPRDDEMSDLASKNTDSVTKAFQAGMVSQRTALKELRQQAEMTGMWSNITDEDIEKADASVMQPDEGMSDLMNGVFGTVHEAEEKAPQPQRTSDAKWEESKHPRQPDGRFGTGAETRKFDRQKRRREVKLSKEEYARVVSALNTNLTKEEREKKILQRAIGNYNYIIENNGFDNYRIIAKIKID